MPLAALQASPASPYNDIQMWPHTAHCVSLQLTYTAAVLSSSVCYTSSPTGWPFVCKTAFHTSDCVSASSREQQRCSPPRHSRGRVQLHAHLRPGKDAGSRFTLSTKKISVLITELNNFHRKIWILKREILMVQMKFYNLTWPSNISLAKIVPSSFS